MKYTIAFVVCILVDIGIGWYWGHSSAIPDYKREALEHLPAIEAQTDAFIRQRADYIEAAKPYEASGASIALLALKSLATNDVDGARAELTTTIGNYYRSHSGDGDTNLLTDIAAYAVKDTVLSNAIYHK